jgi:hypothetical protein
MNELDALSVANLTHVAPNHRVSWMEALAKVAPWLYGGDREFAESLARQFDRKGRLSDKQWSCVKLLAVRGMDRAPTAALQDISYN